MTHQLVNQDSGDCEHYTPEELMLLTHRVLGHIDLDPASNELANEVVRAKSYFTKHDNGLSKPWFGKVWMNHPFHKGENACKANCKKKTCINRGHCITENIPSNYDWTSYLANEYEEGRVDEAICITFSSMSEVWMTEPLLPRLQCFPRGRIHYRKPDGTINKQATKGSVLTYFGKNGDKFKQVFSEIGTVK